MNPPARDLGDLGAAARARLPALVVDGQEVPYLALERRGHARAKDPDRLKRASTLGRPVQRIDLFAGETRPLAEWQESRGVEDLVAVSVADPGHERLIAEEVLELARVAPDTLAPGLERERGVIGVGTLGPDPPRPGNGSIDAGRL